MKEKVYGYMLIDELNDLGIGACQQSTIYTILWRLEKLGIVKTEQKIVSHRARRVYSITLKGRKMFNDIKKNKIRGMLREFMKEIISK